MTGDAKTKEENHLRTVTWRFKLTGVPDDSSSCCGKKIDYICPGKIKNSLSDLKIPKFLDDESEKKNITVEGKDKDIKILLIQSVPSNITQAQIIKKITGLATIITVLSDDEENTKFELIKGKDSFFEWRQSEYKYLKPQKNEAIASNKKENAIFGSEMKVAVLHAMAAVFGITVGLLLMFAHHFSQHLFYFSPILCASIAVPSILILGSFIFKNACSIKRMKMDHLFAFTLLVILVASILNLSFPFLGFPMLCHSGLMIVGFRNLGAALHKFMAISTELNRKKVKDLSEEVIPNLKVGDAIIVKAGEKIPYDGDLTEIIAGEAALDTSSINGKIESEVSLVKPKLYQGCKLTKGQIKMKISKSFEDSFYQHGLTLLKDETGSTSKYNKNRESKIIPIYFIALISCALLAGGFLAIFTTPLQGLLCAIGIFVASCPCTLGAIEACIVNIAKRKADAFKVVPQNLAAFEDLSEASAFVFDNSGTLVPFVKIDSIDCTANTEDEKNNIKSKILALEKGVHNPKGYAIYEELFSNNLPIPAVKITDEKNNRGRCGWIAGEEYYIGNAIYLKEKKKNLEKYIINKPTEQNKIYFFNKEKILAEITIGDPKVEDDTVYFIDTLKRLKKEVSMLTGDDNKENIKKIAERCGIQNCYIDRKPDDKKTYIKGLQNEKQIVVMIGDSDNDKLALKQSNVGIGFRNAVLNLESQNNASFLLPPQNSIEALHYLFVLSQKTLACVNQSLYLALTLAALSVFVSIVYPLITGFALDPAFMAIGMVMQIALVYLRIQYFSSFCSIKSIVSKENTKIKKSGIQDVKPRLYLPFDKDLDKEVRYGEQTEANLSQDENIREERTTVSISSLSLSTKLNLSTHYEKAEAPCPT